MREIIRLDIEGRELIGTYHHADPTPAQKLAGDVPVVGLLFNAGHIPREGNAGLHTTIANFLTSVGIPVFRFDLPGFGDTPGAIPGETETLFTMIHQGYLTDYAVGLTKKIHEWSGGAKVLLGGLCGGAQISMHVASRASDYVAGVIALEPEFFLKLEIILDSHTKKRFLTRAFWLRYITRHNRAAVKFPLPDGIRFAVLKLGGQALLPRLTDFYLISVLKDMVANQTPLLLIMAKNRPPEIFYDQIFQVLFQDRQPANMTHISIPKTNHIFTANRPHDQIIQAIADWSREKFKPGAIQNLD